MFRDVPECSTFLVLSTPGFHRTTCGFLSHPEAKITEFGDQQVSKISVRTKYFFVRCTRATNLEPWAPQVEYLGARRAPQNFYSGDQLWGLGALAKMLGSPKGSLKFSLEHSLDLKGLCQLECTRSEVMQITFNCQNSIVFNAWLSPCALWGYANYFQLSKSYCF